MDRQLEPPINRFVIAALVDRLIYDSDTAFAAEDAATLLAAIPHRRAPRFEFGIAGKMKGGSSRGYAPGVGDVKIDDQKDKAFAYSTADGAYIRAGQWKLLWARSRQGQTIEIEQVMADVIDEGRGARIHYDQANRPVAMDIRFNRAFRFFFIVVMVPGWRPWKTPG